MKTTTMKSQISILALFLLLTACGGGKPNENGENPIPDNAAPVYVQELQPSDFRHYVTVLGMVESDKTIMITPKTSAAVEKILVRAGDYVKKGDVLAKLDGEITRTQLQQAETQLELAKTLFERQSNLREQNIGSEVEYLQAKTQYETAKSQLATLKEQYENYTIRAAISGTINRIDLKVGETVGPGAPVFQLANSDALKVTAAVSEAYISRIEKTDSVEISFTSIDDTIRKQLDVVSRVINPSNRTFGIEAYIPNNSEHILPNMMAKVKVNDITLRNQIVVPVNTVQKANNESFLFVAEETDNGWIASSRKVELSHSYNNSMVIKDGLRVGELLITDGYAELSDGQPISIQKKNN